MTTTEPTLRPTDCDDHSPAPAGPNEGHLLVRRGLGRTAITTDPALPGLYTARFAGPSPRRSEHGGTVELTYPVVSVRRHRAADVLTLTGSIPWRIEVDGGVGELTADLADVSLRSVEVRGGVSRTTLELPTPVGTLPVRLGSVDDVVIRRPAGVAVRVSVRRGARSLRVDDQVLGAAGGPSVLATPGFATADHRIDISVDAARGLTVSSRPNG
jgi:hypothetical protein